MAAARRLVIAKSGELLIMVCMEFPEHVAPPPAQQKKPSFPIGDRLRSYLVQYRREKKVPVSYERLRRFAESAPLTDASGSPTLWETVVYDRSEMDSLNDDLKYIYALLRVDGDLSVMQHL
ncbi:MAG: hypothetical protein WC378_06700, partial [Opitutaceae bacterium]